MSNVANSANVKLDDVLALDSEQTESTILQQEREIFEAKATQRGPLPFSYLEWIPNVRPEQDMDLPRMEHSIKTRGVLEDFPIVVSKRSAKKFAVLRGNRRTIAVRNIKEAEPEIFDMLLPDGKYPAVIVLENLTTDEENFLMVDHSGDLDRTPLSDEGLFIAVCRLMECGVTGQADIAAKLNLYTEKDGERVPNRSYIQQRVNLAKLPEEVQAEFVKLMQEGKDATNVRWGQVQKLYSAWLAGRQRGEVDGGMAFQKLWKEIKSGKKKSPKASMVSKKALTNKAEKFSSRNALRMANVITGEAKPDSEGRIDDLQIIDAEMTELERAADLLNDIAEFMGETKFKKLKADVYKWRSENPKLEEEE